MLFLYLNYSQYFMIFKQQHCKSIVGRWGEHVSTLPVFSHLSIKHYFSKRVIKLQVCRHVYFQEFLVVNMCTAISIYHRIFVWWMCFTLHLLSLKQDSVQHTLSYCYLSVTYVSFTRKGNFVNSCYSFSPFNHCVLGSLLTQFKKNYLSHLGIYLICPPDWS